MLIAAAARAVSAFALQPLRRVFDDDRVPEQAIRLSDATAQVWLPITCSNSNQHFRDGVTSPGPILCAEPPPLFSAIQPLQGGREAQPPPALRPPPGGCARFAIAQTNGLPAIKVMDSLAVHSGTRGPRR